MMRKSLMAVALGLSMMRVTAQNKPAPPVNPDGMVAVGGVSILTFRFPAAGMSIKQRADAVTARIRAILADPALKPSDIVAVPMDKSNAKIMVKDRLLVTIDEETARFNTTTPLALAQAWTQHLRKVLPQLNVKPNPNQGEPVGTKK